MKRFVLYLLVSSLWASTASAVSTLNIAWQDNSRHKAGFNVEPATSASGPFTKIATTGANVTTYNDTSLPEATNLWYRVNAFNTTGASAYSNVICAVTKATLNIAKVGNGSGRIVSVPAGLNCTGSCAAQFTGNSTITLSATPAGGSLFTGWSGACTGVGSCTVTMSNQVNVFANFYLNALALSGSSSGA